MANGLQLEVERVVEDALREVLPMPTGGPALASLKNDLALALYPRVEALVRPKGGEAEAWAEIEAQALHCPVLYALVTAVQQDPRYREQALMAVALQLSRGRCETIDLVRKGLMSVTEVIERERGYDGTPPDG